MSEKESKRVVERVWEEIVNQGDLDACDELIADEYTYRAPGGLELHGPEGFRRYIASLHELVADVDVTVHEYIVDGNRVLSRWTGRATNRETRHQVTWRGATITHVADGKVVDDWEYWDRLEVAEQLAGGWLQRRLVAVVAKRTMEKLPSG